jgi:hypothetical protein
MPKAKPAPPLKLLFIDIETTPIVAMTWGLFNQNISVDQVLKPHSLLCFAAKWRGDKQLFYHASPKQEGRDFNDMVRAAHRLLSEADAIVHFNGTSFDVPRLNTQFVKLGLPPPPPVPQIDLKKVVMSKFDMTSSKLAFVGPYLKIGEKVKNSGWELWQKCLDGNGNAWLEMEKYNKQDVVLLEKLYDRVLPWIDGHPNLNLYVDEKDPVCPSCGSEKPLQRRGYVKTVTNAYVRYSCTSCGRWSRARSRDRQFGTVEVR